MRKAITKRKNTFYPEMPVIFEIVIHESGGVLSISSLVDREVLDRYN